MNGLSLAAAVDLVLQSGLFDAHHYMAVAGLGAEPDDALVRHYLEHGEAAALSVHPLFDTAFYRSTYLAGSEPGSTLIDYIQQGHGPRWPNPLFDQAFYLRSVSGTVAPDVTPLLHYCQEGWLQGRDPHPLFSVRQYLERYEDIRAAGAEPLQHFISSGWREGRVPCPGFDSDFYLATNTDVGATGVNPLLHFAQYGADEGRNPSASFDLDWYRGWMRGDPDAALFPNPLAHYIHAGRARGYSPYPANLRLDEAGAVDRASFETWVAEVVNSWQHAMPSYPARPVLIVAADPSSMPPDAIAFADLPAWLAAPPPLPDPLLLFTQPGDRLYPPAQHILAHAFAASTPSALCTTDSVCFEADTARPVLLPGSNRVYLLNAPVIPPFCADAALCRAHPPLPGEQLAPWFRRMVAAAADAGALDHLPVPVLEVPPDRHAAMLPRPDVAAIVDQVCPDPGSPPGQPVVSVIICTKDCGHLLTQLVLGLLRPGTGGVKEVILVLNQPRNAFATAYHQRLAGLERVRIVDYDKDYNFSDQCNEGARHATSRFLLFLNDDIMPVGDRWLSQMLLRLEDPRVAIVGPLLLYPNETVQHAGMYLGFNAVCGHCLRGVRLPRPGSSAGLVPANCSAVTGAVMLIRADVFEALNGFDYSLATYLQDLDLCLRVLRMGHEIVYDPTAILFHMESISGAATLRDPAVHARRGREHERFYRRWQAALQLDRYHNVNWLIQDESLSTLAAAQPTRYARLAHG